MRALAGARAARLGCPGEAHPRHVRLERVVGARGPLRRAEQAVRVNFTFEPGQKGASRSLGSRRPVGRLGPRGVRPKASPLGS